MKKLKLIKWVKNTLTVITLIALLLGLKSMQKSFVETCVEQGYSVNYCIEHS